MRTEFLKRNNDIIRLLPINVYNEINYKRFDILHVQATVIVYFQLLTSVASICVILLILMGHFYWYHCGIVVCTDSQVTDYFTSWISSPERSEAHPCWTDLASYTCSNLQMNWFDYIILVSSYGLLVWWLHVIMYIILYFKNPAMGTDIVDSMLVAMSHAMCSLLFFAGAIVFFNGLRSSIYSPELRNIIGLQLKTSLARYNEDGFHLRKAWDNTMREGCCGVDGYQDFSNVNMSIPSVCQTELYSGSPISKEVRIVLVDGNATVSHGCVDSIMSHIQSIGERSTLIYLIISGLLTIIFLVTLATMRYYMLEKSKSIVTFRKNSGFYIYAFNSLRSMKTHIF